MWVKASNPADAFLKAYDLVRENGEPNEDTKRVTGVVIELSLIHI